ncbi:H-2 class II histocompatibility antigen, A-Q beta chain-like [Cervus elaphus]|uniref:H-2 class II histocompatibility antigen, A-Q beta chain-like n=1 Tax=Cervus elaphus TaxID=9860 RepID=UPI001CC28675|nr:H-2 class II histocompatibility antigen, A-Q beta chain-like [Cervus elaphus]
MSGAAWGCGADGLTERLSPLRAFLHQFKGLCYFTSWTELLRSVVSNQRFDSDAGEGRAVTELGRPQAERWNSQKDVLQRRRAEVDAVCRQTTGLLPGDAVP